MIRKSYYNNGNTCRVTFRYEPSQPVESVYLVSEFDNWDPAARPMARRKDGSYSVSLTLSQGRYRFRYLLDGETWVNDSEADEYVDNAYGDTDGVVHV